MTVYKVQYNTQYNAAQCTLQFNGILFIIHYNAINAQHNTTQSTTQCTAIQYTLQYDTAQCTIQYNTIWFALQYCFIQ